jgi:hypothetical protein
MCTDVHTPKHERNVLVFLMRSTKEELLACPSGLALSGCDICDEDIR